MSTFFLVYVKIANVKKVHNEGTRRRTKHITANVLAMFSLLDNDKRLKMHRKLKQA